MAGVTERARIAASNNADLCSAIMVANGLRTERDNLAYFCIDMPLPYYPKIVTLEPTATSELDARISGHSGIKDSFSCLDEAALGLRVAFEASWIWSCAQTQQQPTQWVRIDTPNGLLRWHTAWNGNNDLDQVIFPPQCLNDPKLFFLARISGTKIEAGCLANLSTDVIGMSNVFTTQENDEGLYSDALAAVSSVGDGLPVAGYEQGNDLECACAAGFQVVGPLRILVR